MRIVTMSNGSNASLQDGVADVVRRLLAQRSIVRAVAPDEELRDAGLTSLDMVNLVLSIEAKFEIRIPEAKITPANFRSVAAIDALVTALRSQNLAA